MQIGKLITFVLYFFWVAGMLFKITFVISIWHVYPRKITRNTAYFLWNAVMVNRRVAKGGGGGEDTPRCPTEKSPVCPKQETCLFDGMP